MALQTERYEDTQLYKIRHSAAHVMAQAVLEIFPDGKVTIVYLKHSFVAHFQILIEHMFRDLMAFEVLGKITLDFSVRVYNYNCLFL